MATAREAIGNELSLDLSQLSDHEDDITTSEDLSREIDSISTGHDDIEELILSDHAPPKPPESTRLDLSGLSDSSVDGTQDSGLSITRDRVSALPSVHSRQFLSGDAWTGSRSGSDTDTGSERSRRAMRQSRLGQNPNRSPSLDARDTLDKQTDKAISVDKLPSVNVRASVSPTRSKPVGRGVAFGSAYIRDSSFQSTRLYGRPPGLPRALPPFLRAHARERRFPQNRSTTVTAQSVETNTKDIDKIEMPKDFATLHLLARRSQGQLRYKYMAMLNQWIAEHGVPTT